MRVPRIPATVSYISAVAALLVIPYYFTTNQPTTAWAMSGLAALNFASGWWPRLSGSCAPGASSISQSSRCAEFHIKTPS